MGRVQRSTHRHFFLYASNFQGCSRTVVRFRVIRILLHTVQLRLLQSGLLQKLAGIPGVRFTSRTVHRCPNSSPWTAFVTRVIHTSPLGRCIVFTIACGKAYASGVCPQLTRTQAGSTCVLPFCCVYTLSAVLRQRGPLPSGAAGQSSCLLSFASRLRRTAQGVMPCSADLVTCPGMHAIDVLPVLVQ